MQAEMNQISALFQQGELEAARKMCRALVQKHPGNDKVRYAHAMICQQAGDIDAAIEAYRMTVKISPSHLQALANLGGLLVSSQQFDEAVEPLMRALKLDPNSAPARYNLAQAYHGQNKLPAALHEAKVARELDDNVADVHSFIGTLAKKMRFYDEASAAFERFNQLKPKEKEPWLQRATTLQFAGDFKHAEEVLKEGLKHHPGDAEFHMLLSVAKRPAEQEAVSISSMRSALDEGKFKEREQVGFLYALGRLYERAGDFEKAIDSFHQANRRKKVLEPYDNTAPERQTERIISVFTPEFFSRRADFGNDSKKPVFIVGMPRSGTTLLERLLATHPDVAGVGELGDFSVQCRREGFGPAPEWLRPDEIAELSQNDISGLAANFLSRLEPLAPGVKRAVDSTPGNFFQAGLIKLTFPNACIIHATRNPIDSALSIYCQDFEKGNIPYANDLSDIVVLFRCRQQLLRHFKDELGFTIHNARYEDIVADAPGQIAPLLTAMDLDPAEASFDNTASQDAIQSASVWQARQPVYKTSVEKWRNYEKHIGPLIDGLADLEY